MRPGSRKVFGMHDNANISFMSPGTKLLAKSWMDYFMEIPMKMDDLGVPSFSGNHQI
jgi:hypothetical protein